MQAPVAKDEAVYTLAEAARFKGVSYHTASRAIRTGKLPSTRLGRQALIRESDLAAWEPMVERRPKKYAARIPDPGVRPAAILPGVGDGLAGSRSIERVAPLLAILGGDGAPGVVLQEILASLAATLHCEDAAIVYRIPGGNDFEVRATIGSHQDWLSPQDEGARVITQPIRLAGRPLGLFVGIPDDTRPALTNDDREAALAMLTLAGVALAWS